VDQPAEAELLLRPPGLDDESQVAEAKVELAEEGFDFAFRSPDEPWPSYVTRVSQEHLGLDLAPDRVPNTFLLACVDGDIVGRVSIRHALNAYLTAVGGHIGYAVRPAYRRRGYARSILRQSLELAREIGLRRVLITCDDDNVASVRLIEHFGGALENVITADPGSVPTRRYWIDLADDVG
jgi:predicted acetyltransferase